MPLNPVTFPFWWYSTGLSLFFDWAKKSLALTVKKSAIRIFMSHMGQTLYGYSSWQDKIVSFFLRIALLLIKLFSILLKAVFLAIAVVLYLAAIPGLVALLIYYLIP